VELPREEIKSLLERVEVSCTPGEGGFVCTPPSFRNDLSLEEDLIEEIARLYGYDRLPSTIPVAEIGGRPPEKLERLAQKAKGILTALSLYEVINYSFISPRFVEALELTEDDPRRRVVPLANPLSEEQSVMRTTLVPGLLETARVNIFREAPDLKVFELGRVFWAREGGPLPHERLYLAGLLAGRARPESCHERPRKVDYFDLKGILETFLRYLGVADFRLVPQGKEPFLRPGMSARLEVAGKDLGFLGEIRPQILEKYDLPGPIFVFELDFEALVECVSEEKKYRPLPKFPATTRDLAMVLDDAVPAEEVLGYVRSEKVPYLEEVYILDVYRGKPIPEGKKSLTLRFVYRASDRTLTDEEVNNIQATLSEKVLKRFNAVAR
jgi:phenylalanyl-tRNA synthetase beta chain